MQLTLVISSLTFGGAQRVMSILANEWADRGWTVTLMTFDDGRDPPFFKLHGRIRHIPLAIAGRSSNSAEAILNNLKRIAVLRRAIRKSEPDAVISFLDVTNILTLLATLGCRWPTVVSERSDPSLCPIGAAWSSLRRWLYQRAAAVVVQTQRASSFFEPSIRRRTHVIPNPVMPPPSLRAGGKPDLPGKRVVGLGRLGAEKGFDLLILAFGHVTAQHPDWHLTIWGEGQERAALEALRDLLGLSNRVGLPGRTAQPAEKLQEADLFVLSSRFEGFPNALCEAMSCGLPVISFDCPSGPREIIREDVDGLLVPAGDVGALATAMNRLMSDEIERKRLSSKAVEVVKRFGVKKIRSQWEQVLNQAMSECKR
jgi:GalNAc-alpha-(1->4)-GalNAc-alpha-(1->3)-diNAcBac-PP-undecaprenol alpha-1,4-N-acetyl-D-galactosaminyltransferase